jgi:hypothetical protein
LLNDLKDQILRKKNKHNISFEYIIADTAAARERAELKAL